MNKIPKYSLMLIETFISHAAEYYTGRKILKGNFEKNHFTSGGSAIFEIRYDDKFVEQIYRHFINNLIRFKFSEEIVIIKIK